MKIKICVETGCKNTQTTKGYCRLHYLKNWKEIREASRKKSADKLNKYVEGLCKKFPERYLDVIRREIKNGKGHEGEASEDSGVGEMSEGVFESFGYSDDEESLDRLISRLKIDKDF